MRNLNGRKSRREIQQRINCNHWCMAFNANDWEYFNVLMQSSKKYTVASLVVIIRADGYIVGMHAYIHTCMQACMHAYITYIHTCMHAYILYTHTCMHKYLFTYTHECLYISMHACMHIAYMRVQCTPLIYIIYSSLYTSPSGYVSELSVWEAQHFDWLYTMNDGVTDWSLRHSYRQCSKLADQSIN